MKKLILTFFILSISNANAEQYLWKCFDHMLMSKLTKKVDIVERKKFKTANVYVDTKEKTLKFWSTPKDLLKELANNNPIKHDFFVDNILVNDQMITTSHRPFKKYPNEYNIFSMDLRSYQLIRVVAVMDNKYTKYYDCDPIPLN